MTSPTPFLPQSAADHYCPRPCRKHQPECDTQQLALRREAAESQPTHVREEPQWGRTAWEMRRGEEPVRDHPLPHKCQNCSDISRL